MMPALLTNSRSASGSSYDRDSNTRGRLSTSDSFSNGREDSSGDRRELTGTGSRCDVKVNSGSHEGTSRRWSVVTVAAVVVVVMAGLGAGSELPDRECCDSAPPPPPHYLTVTSTSTTSTTQPPVHGSSSEVSRDKKEIMNCLQAKIECERDANCSALLKVVPILCGPEIVACSTVTVSRCQAALRTLVLFTWFVPTCVCGNPKYDIQCNTFKDLLFEHPCVYLNRKDMNTDPLQHIPACDRAADLCRDDLWCKPRLDRFRTACKIRDGHCRNRDRERCVRAWLQVRDTPLLGCICPEDGDKKCSRLYSLINQNPCVGDSYPARVDTMSRVSEVLGTPLTRKVPMPTAAVSLLVVSMSHSDPLYPLSVIHHFFQHRPGEGNDYNGSLDLVRMVAATCHSALLECQDDEGCSSHLLMAKGHCTSYCHQNACRRSIQDMYKHLMENNQDLALKIALCVCKTGEGRDHARCIRAQLYFHPPCAQRTETLPATQCHHLGQDCRTDRVCRYRLEQYEVGCAADLLTGECAGSPSSCRMGVVGVLGSRLHTDCECNSLDMQELHQCYSWKRLLWGNPCVVEAQLTYHLETLREKQVEEEQEEEEEEAGEEKREEDEEEEEGDEINVYFRLPDDSLLLVSSPREQTLGELLQVVGNTRVGGRRMVVAQGDLDEQDLTKSLTELGLTDNTTLYLLTE